MKNGASLIFKGLAHFLFSWYTRFILIEEVVIMTQPKFIKSMKIPSLENCLNVVKSCQNFISKVEIVDGVEIISFSYRLASFSDFDRQFARNLRSISFEKNTGKIVCLGFHKFFNYGENPFTEEKVISKWNPCGVFEKVDGSLILFFMVNGNLHAKTKMNSYSEQAQIAMEIVNRDSFFKGQIINDIENGFTPMFELISPRDPHVLNYNCVEELRYIISRNMTDGKYEIHSFNTIAVEQYHYSLSEVLDICVNDKIKNIEGFVVHFTNGEMVKVKTKSYIQNHHIRDNILNKRIVAEMILEEKIDDAKNQFRHSPYLIKFIEMIEKDVVNRYNEFLNNAQNFYNSNKELERKAYAIKAKSVFSDITFGLAIELFLNQLIDEKKFKKRFLRYWKDTENIEVVVNTEDEDN